ncbi:MAG: methionyl-tRNA formyltransferase [Phycisphaerae bacterium]|jgi:methionyl-tRNA formyltransferase|nr:methionyl-tRNA formyltransferase [Phycisphaerae bacterium]
MRILFLGSGEFGQPTLELLAKEHDLVGVVTSPDRPAGRNRSDTPTPIGAWAEKHGVPLFKTDNVNADEFVQKIDNLSPDAVVVIAFGQKLSVDFIGNRPTINLHASLLPRWRGAAPINAAIVHGDTKSGVSVITLAEKMDAGLILGQHSTVIAPTETAGELHDRLALLGPALILEVLSGDFSGELQDEGKVTYAPKMSRNDAKLDLSQSAIEVSNAIRGYSPWPGCHLTIVGDDCKIIRAIPKESNGEIGEVLEDGTIAVGDGSIEILDLKPSGGKMMTWKDFCNGRSVKAGSCCEVPE